MIVVIIVVLLALLLGVAATRPDTFRVGRATSINAPPEKIFAFINDFHRWTSWSPYEKLDPALKRTYSGADSGKGAVYEWQGSAKAGKGRMEITESTVPLRIIIKLDFIKPFEGHNIAEFSLQPAGSSTGVTWAMHGPSSFMYKLMGLVFNMDKMIGGQFAEGLANLKAVAEK